MNSLPVVWGGTFRVGDTPARGARHVYLPSPRRAKRCESPVLSASEATTFSLHEGLEIREAEAFPSRFVAPKGFASEERTEGLQVFCGGVEGCSCLKFEW